MGDISYGACCIDDLLGQQLEMDLLIHYGHSCLVPITETVVKILYVFVEIEIDIKHCVDTIVHNHSNKNIEIEDKLGLMGTIQFSNCIFRIK